MATDDDITGPINPAEFTIAELAEVTKEITNSRSKLVDKPFGATVPGRTNR